MTNKALGVKRKGRRLSDLPLTPAQCRGARAMLAWKQEELAEKAGVSRPVVVDFEKEARIPMPQNLVALRRALEEAGLEFIGQNGGGPGIRFRLPMPEPLPDEEA